LLKLAEVVLFISRVEVLDHLVKTLIFGVSDLFELDGIYPFLEIVTFFRHHQETICLVADEHYFGEIFFPDYDAGKLLLQHCGYCFGFGFLLISAHRQKLQDISDKHGKERILQELQDNFVWEQIAGSCSQMGRPVAERVYYNYGRNILFEGCRRTYYQADKSIKLEGTFRPVWTHSLLV
jgi:hypothetical protein